MMRRVALWLAIFVFITASLGNPVSGQISLPSLGGAAQNFAVSQALSAFAKTIGDQLPIVVPNGDAYPTVASLPGAPFSPRALPPGTIAALRSSTDGTIPLLPGDYQTQVDVFCMRASAHSPAGRRYVVAQLEGSAADIIRALNSRLPSFSTPHIEAQVLSWDIQAGLPYSQMAPAQRAIVDRIIPEYRSRLDDDVYQRISGQYTTMASRIPGMPSFEDALGRLGSAGAAIVQMQQLRQQLAQPPENLNQLVQQLVPELPAGATASQPGGFNKTPWSRYSDRVYVRFVTAGNYATPGTYQIRVMAAAPGQASDPPVPMANIVNNPQDANTQPLTQIPNGNPANQPAPTPTPTPSITIETNTLASTPSDHTRKLIGVAEQVKLTCSCASANWQISGSGGYLQPSNGKSVTYYATLNEGTESIQATDPSTGAKASVDFTVIAPHAAHYYQKIPLINHHVGRPDIGFLAYVWLQPGPGYALDAVSFQYIIAREVNANTVATGTYATLNGQPHYNNNGVAAQPPAAEVGPFQAGKGWYWGTDNVYSGDPTTVNAPFGPGTEKIVIPIEYQRAPENPPAQATWVGGSGTRMPFTVTQAVQLDANGKITATKGDITPVVTSVDSPTGQ
jgi:hypothetical protein